MRETLKLRQEMEGRAPDRAGVRNAVTFDNLGEGRIWFMNRYSQLTRRAYGLTVSLLDGEGSETSRLLAREAWREEGGGGWVLRDGRELTFDVASGEVLQTRRFTELRRPDFDEDPALMQVYDARPDELSLFELQRVIDHHRTSGSPKALAYELRHASLLAESLMPLVIIAFAIPFAVAGVRVNPAVGVSKALGLFLVYFVALRVGLVLGEQGVFSPVLAAVLPHLALLGAGAWAWARVR